MNISKQPWHKYRDKLLPIIQATEKRNTHIFSDAIDKILSDGRPFCLWAVMTWESPSSAELRFLYTRMGSNC